MRTRLRVAAVWIALATALAVSPVAGVAGDPPQDGHQHGDLEELTGQYLQGSDLLVAERAATAASTFFNESAGCGEPRGVMPPLTTTNSTSNRSIPSGHQVRGPWGNFFGRNYSDVSGSMVNWVVPMSGGKTVKVHRRALPAFERVSANLAAEAANGRNYNVRIAGSWVWRRIGGLYRMSTHAFGVSIDLNWDTNLFSSDNKLVSDMPEWFVDAWRDAGFCWGGDWQTVKDAMHFAWKGPFETPGYGKLGTPYAPKTPLGDYTDRAARLTSTFGSLDGTSTYSFFDGNSDGAPDVFRVEPWGDDDLLVSYARSSTNFSPCGVSTAVFEGGARGATKLVVADLAGTGRADVWGIDDDGSKLRIRVGRYTDRYRETVVLTPGINADQDAEYLAADHNLDGIPDLYIVHRGSTTKVDVYNGATGFTTKLYGATISVPNTTDATRWRFDVMDHDVDGRPDLVVIEVGGSVKLRVFSGASKLATKIRTVTTGAAALKAAVYEIEDWDGDGRGDLMMMTPAGVVRVYLGGVQTASDTFWFQPSGWSCRAVGSDVPWDVNGDRIADMPIGVPGEQVGSADDAGIVQMLYGTKAGPTATGSQRWDQDRGTIASSAEPGDRFGSAMASGDFDGDGHADLAVGAPNDGVGGVAGAGLVNVIRGSGSGLTDSGNVMIHRDVPGVLGVARPNATFGAVLATGDFNNDGWDDLAIGAPRDKVGNYRGAGSVSIVYGSKQGLLGSKNQIWSQASKNIKGNPASGDWFGAALATGDFDGDGYDDLAIGAPFDDLAGENNAGVVNVLYGTANGLHASGNDRFSQAFNSIPGTPKKGDRFGMALAAGDFDLDGKAELAIGIPGDPAGSQWHAGAVLVLKGTSTGLVTWGDQYWNAGVAGVPGTPDKGDEMGATLTVGDFNRDGFADLVMGHPGESIPNATQAGAVTVLYGTGAGLTSAGADLWLQGHDGLPATAEDGDRFGDSLRAADVDGDGYDDLIVGMPAEDLDVPEAGAVMVIYGETGGLQAGGARIWHEESPGLSGTASAGDALGML